MLSIDITDTRISLICGSARGKHVTVEKALTRELKRGCIDNGFVKDIRTLAGEITEFLVTEKVVDKETVVSINSGQIIFKEMFLPKPKKSNPEALLERMIRNDMGLTNDYNFTYSIVREEKSGKLSMLRILAVACPQRMIDGYEMLFKQLGLKLKAILSGNACVARMFANTEKYKERMPLIALELENDFIGFNLFEDEKLSLSRYVKLDNIDSDRDNAQINQTVFDNLYRIVQLFGQGAGKLPANEIMYYGFVGDAESLEQSISQFNIPVSRLEKPDEVTFNADAEYSEYASLIGSLYPINKKTENINLLYSFKYRNNIANLKFLGVAVFTLVACIIAIYAAGSSLNFHVKQRNRVLSSYSVEYEMLRPAELGVEKTDLLNAISKFDTYSEKVELARELFYFQPKMIVDIVSKLRRELLPGMQINGNVVVSSYSVTATFICASNDQPSRYTEALDAAGYFDSISFDGYQRVGENKYSFNLTMKIKGGNRFEVQ